MIQPGFRKILKVLAQRATAAKKHQSKHGQHSPTPLAANSKDPLYQLSCAAQEVSLFFQSQRLAGVAGSREANALSALLRPIKNHGGPSATIDDLERITELVANLLAGKPFVPRGTWQCPEKDIVVPPRLALALKAYLGGKLEYKLTAARNPRYKKTELKRLIQLARDEGGYHPDPDRWPRSENLAGGGDMLVFDAKEDGIGRWRPALRMG